MRKIFPRTALWLCVTVASAAVAFSAGRSPQAAPESADRIERGRSVFYTVCTSCHDLDLIEHHKMSKENWGYVVGAMIEMGAELSEEQTELVVEYLGAAYGSESSEQ